MNETADPQEIIAFTLGNFWLCPRCARSRLDEENLATARRADLMPAYSYHCDQCRRPIR